jgi:MoaA/NifB/PqqE/SkfB family radical SAM enzyme
MNLQGIVMKAGIYFELFASELRRLLWGKKFIMEVDATNHCNLNCVHCYHYKNNPRPESIGIDEWERRFREYAARGVKLVLFVGGEPALRQDVLFLARRYFLGIGVISNGTIQIDPRFKHRIVVSVDGARETNDRLRGDGVFDLIEKNYRGDQRVVLNCVLSKYNYREVPEIVRLAKEMQVKGAVFDFYTPDMGEGEELVLNDEQREESRELIYRQIETNRRWVYMTRYTVDALVERHAAKDCYWRKYAYHFDVHLKPRRCFSDRVDCSRCGCIMGAWKNPFRTNPGQLLMTKKLFFD